MMKGTSLFIKNQRGAAAAEMALILPLVLVLLFSTFEGAYYIMCEHRVVKGVRDAARYAGRLDFSNYSCPSSPSNGNTVAEGEFEGDEPPIQNLARTGQLVDGTPVLPRWDENSSVTIEVSCRYEQEGLYSVTEGVAPQVRVSADVEYPALFSTLGLGTTDWRLKASAESPVMGL